MITIVDCGGANLGSVTKALDRLDQKWKLTDRPEDIGAAERILLPGVGSAKVYLEQARERGIWETLKDCQQPILGICIGLQVQYEFLDEGPCAGFGLLPGEVVEFEASENLPVPHMGWNQLEEHFFDPLLKEVSGEFFYFTHSYYGPLNDFTVASATYGINFAAVTRRNNWWGVQFHPEKSSEPGLRVLKNFTELKI